MPSDSASLYDGMRALLPSQKPKGSLMVLMRFSSGPERRERYVLTDIPLGPLKEMHALYERSMGSEATSEGFVKAVHEALGKDSPRILRDVDYLPL